MNGQEKDDEIANGIYTAEFWEYDARLGRRWNVDPVIKIWESPYLCFSGNPVLYSDPNGDDVGYETRGDRIRVFFKRIFNKDFRKDFNSKKSEANMYTYRLRAGKPALQDAKEKFDSGRTFTTDGVSDSDTDPTIVTANFNVDYSVNGSGKTIGLFIPLYKKIYPKRKPFEGDPNEEYSVETKHLYYDDKHPIYFNTLMYPDDITIEAFDKDGNTLGDTYHASIITPYQGESLWPSSWPCSPLYITPGAPIVPRGYNDSWQMPTGTTKIKITVSSTSQRSKLKADGTPAQNVDQGKTLWNMNYYKWRWTLKQQK